MMTFADRGYQGAGGSVRTPFKRHRRRQRLSRREKAVNRWSHARIRALGERAIATLKSWRLLSKLRDLGAAAGQHPVDVCLVAGHRRPQRVPPGGVLLQPNAQLVEAECLSR
jgi:hypothetical protein